MAELPKKNLFYKKSLVQVEVRTHKLPEAIYLLYTSTSKHQERIKLTWQLKDLALVDEDSEMAWDLDLAPGESVLKCMRVIGEEPTYAFRVK